jgi:hypothetical protein
VRHGLVGLHRELEAGRRLLDEFHHHGGMRNPIIGGVDLHAGKMLNENRGASLGVPGVEGALPVVDE